MIFLLPYTQIVCLLYQLSAYVCYFSLDFALIMTNLHISLEAVEWRMEKVAMHLLILKCVSLN